METNHTALGACLKTAAYFKWRALIHGTAMLGAMLLTLMLFQLTDVGSAGLGVLVWCAAAAGVWGLDTAACRRAAQVRCQHDRAIRHFFRGDPLRADTRMSAIVTAAKARFTNRRGAIDQIRRTRAEFAAALKHEPFASLPSSGLMGILLDPLASLALGIRTQQGAVRAVISEISERGKAAGEALGALCAAYWIIDVGVFLIGCALGNMRIGMLPGLVWGYALMQLVSRALLSPVFAAILSGVVYPRPREVDGAGEGIVVEAASGSDYTETE